MFIVKMTYLGREHFLRSTIWTVEVDRAQKFTTREAAEVALDKAKKFMVPATKKLPIIVSVE